MPTFNSQHYRAIARVVKESRSYPKAATPAILEDDSSSIMSISKLIDMLCLCFKLDNPRFNADAFRKACGDNLD